MPWTRTSGGCAGSQASFRAKAACAAGSTHHHTICSVLHGPVATRSSALAAGDPTGATNSLHQSAHRRTPLIRVAGGRQAGGMVMSAANCFVSLGLGCVLLPSTACCLSRPSAGSREGFVEASGEGRQGGGSSQALHTQCSNSTADTRSHCKCGEQTPAYSTAPKQLGTPQPPPPPRRPRHPARLSRKSAASQHGGLCAAAGREGQVRLHTSGHVSAAAPQECTSGRRPAAGNEPVVA